MIPVSVAELGVSGGMRPSSRSLPPNSNLSKTLASPSPIPGGMNASESDKFRRLHKSNAASSVALTEGAPAAPAAWPATPQADNQWHADIVMPPNAAHDDKERFRHAAHLASCAKWRPRPGPA